MDQEKFYKKSGFKKSLIIFGVIVIFIAIVFGVYKISDFSNNFQNDKNISFVKGTITSQLPSAPGEPIKWVKTVSVNQSQHLLVVPGLASNIKISTTSLSVIPVKTGIQSLAKLTNADRIKLSALASERASSSESLALAKSLKPKAHGFFAFFSNIFSKIGSMFATVDEALAPPEDTTIVIDLASSITPVEQLSEPLPEDSNKKDKEEKTNKKENKQSEEVVTPEVVEVSTTSEPVATTTEEVSAEVGTSTEIISTEISSSSESTFSSSSVIASSSEAIHSSSSDSLDSVLERNDSSVATTTATSSTVLVSYETPPPVIAEADTDTGKIVTVSASDTITDLNATTTEHITNVLAFTNIPEIYKVGQESKIKIKWKNNGDQNVTFHAYDLNGNGRLDYVEWTVPHLSTQTFEIIFISKAFQLDTDQTILSDIYDQVQTQDGNYATIPTDNYVRVTFEKTLTEKNDITIYARPSSVIASGTKQSSPSIEVYPVYTDSDGNQTEGSQLALVNDGTNPDFSNVDHDGKYRILLQNLQTPTDVFDLKISGITDIDYIIDPSNTAPPFSAGPSDGGSATSTPNKSGDIITFTATSTDAESDNYYLAICKTNSVSTTTNGAPTCGGDNWCISDSTASASGASCTHTAVSGDEGSQPWFAFVCDYNANSLCSAMSQGSAGMATSSPFVVDATNPVVTVTSPTNGTYYATTSVTFSATSTDTNLASIIPDLDSSLVSWWRMEDNLDTTAVVDYMGANNGTSVRNTSLMHTTGKIGGAMSFNGVDDTINMGASSQLISDSTDITVSLWTKINAFSGTYNTLISSGPQISSSQPAGAGIFLWFNYGGSDVRFSVAKNSGTRVTTPSSTLIANNWYMISATFNKATGTATLYVNGNLIGSTTDLSVDSFQGSNFYISKVYSSTNSVNGSIDDVMFFNRALTTDEITALYNGTAISHSSTLTEASHTYKAYAEDFAGNIASTSLATFTVDATAPTGTITLGASATYWTTNTSPTIALTTNDAAQYQLCLNSATAGNNCTSVATAWATYTATPTAHDFTSDGAKTLYVQFKDTAGNISVTYSDDITIDTVAPTVSTVAVVTGLTVDVTFSEAMGTGSTTASNYTVSGTGQGTLATHPASVANTSGNTNRLTWTSGEMLNGGDITITVATAQDLAGNTVGLEWSADDIIPGNTTWGPMNVVTGAQNLTDGLANTNILKNLAGSYPAVDACVALTEGGHTDWYLPAKQQLLDAYNNGITGFHTGYYWSSTESTGPSATQAYYVGMHNGLVYNNQKDDPGGPVRCLRYTATGTHTSGGIGTAPTNQDTVFATSTSKIGGGSVTIVSSGDATNNVWFAPSGTTSFVANVTTITTAGGTATTITAPSTAGAYRMFVIDAAGNYSTQSTAILTVDNTAPTFTMQYYYDSALTSTATTTDNAKLPAGTYYVKITGSETLGSTPTVTIVAEGTANDVTNGATVAVSGNDYKYTRTIASDASAVGSVIEDWSVTGTDSAGNTATNANPTNEATKAMYTDTTNPVVTVTSPTNGTYYASTSVSFGASATDTNLASLVPNLDSSLVSWWRMEDSTSTTAVVDYMGANNGTAQQNTSVLHTTGKIGGALSFNGSNSVSTSISNLPLTDLTISFWAKKTSAATGNRPFGYEDSNSGTNGLGMYYQSSTTPSLIMRNAGTTYDMGFGTITIGDWYHYAVTISSSSGTKVYLNNVVGNSNSAAKAYSSASVTFHIGSAGNGSNFFNGSIDDVMIFNRALTTDEITALYNGTAISHSSTLSEASHTYKAYAEDLAGNIASTSLATFTVDATAPTTTDNVPSSWQTGNITTTFTCTDALSGCSKVYYTTDGTAPSTTTSASTTSAFIYSTEGTSTLKYMGLDTAGNLETTKTATNTLMLDKTVATSTFATSTQTDPAGTLVTFSCDDYAVGSGCDRVYYTLDGSEPGLTSLYVEASTTWQFLITSDGDYTIRFFTKDIAGNLGPHYVAPHHVRVDNTKPDTSDDYAFDNVWKNSIQTITLSPHDPSPSSGIVWTKYCFDTTDACVPTDGTDYTVAVSTSTEGITYFRYASRDGRGNVQDTVSRIVKLDTGLPTTSDSATTTAGSYTYGNFTNSNVTVTLTPTDPSPSSGIFSTKYCTSTLDVCSPTTDYATTSPVLISIEGTTYFRYASGDNASNTQTTVSKTVKIDKTLPLISSVSPATGSNLATGQAVTFTLSEAGDCRLALSETAKSYDQMSGDVSCTFSEVLQFSCVAPALGGAGTKNIYIACADSYGNNDTSGTATHLTYTVPSTGHRASSVVNNSTSTNVTVTTPASSLYSISINGGAWTTNNRNVNLQFTDNSSTNATAVVLSTNPDFSNILTIPLNNFAYPYDLCQGRPTCPDSSYTIYAKFLNAQGVSSSVLSDSITLNAVSIITEITNTTREVTQNIASTTANIFTVLLPPKKAAPLVLPPVETTVPTVAPFALLNSWKIILPSSIGKFVFADLPNDFKNIVNKFPVVSVALQKVGINNMNTLLALNTTPISLPGLGETVGMPQASVSLPMTNMSSAQKTMIPTNIIFARTADEKIDLGTKLSIGNDGLALQTLNTIQGQTLKLIVKPETPAKAVAGYIIFKSSSVSVIPSSLSSSNPSVILANAGIQKQNLDSRLHGNDRMVASVVDSMTVTNEGTVNPSTDLVLTKFDYKETSAGIWTADVASPLAIGQYELRTIVNYKANTAPKTISMIVVVDPEGYVYEKINGGEFRIANTSVSIFWLNPKTDTYELWPASDFRQTNPQTTDVTGRYSFLVPVGTYKLKATANGYYDYLGDSFKVDESKGVFINIELKAKWSVISMFNLQNIILGIISLTLIYLAVIFTIRRGKKDKLLV